MKYAVAVSAPQLPSNPWGDLTGHVVEVSGVDDPVEAGVVALEKIQNDYDIPTKDMVVSGFRLKSRS